MKKSFLSWIAGAAVALFPFYAEAHPHAWIDYRTRVIFDGNNRIAAIREHWTFDEYYTEFAAHDFDPHKKGKLDHETLMALAEDNLKNLKEFDYFTQVEENGAKRPVASVSDIASELIDGHITMDFTVHLAAPVDPAKHKVSYRIYDPSYYVSMLHDKKEPIAFDGPKAKACAPHLVAPSPSAGQVSFAASIDKSGKLPDDMGRFFAQTMEISCASK